MLASLTTSVSPSTPKLFSKTWSGDLAKRSRVLCLILQARGTKGKGKNSVSICEALLRFSPRVQFREPNVFFLDIGSTASLFGGEQPLIESTSDLLKNFGFNVQAAISDTPSGANALASSLACSSESHLICPAGEERETLQHLSLPFLLHLQGLKAWEKSKAVEQMISFFQILGFNTLGDLHEFSLMAFKERWGEIGVNIWQRLHSREEQVISPFFAVEPLQEYTYLDFPVSLLSLLLHQARQTTEFLFARLQGRRLFAQKLVLNLRCEYSEAKYKVEIEPQSPSRDLDLFLILLEQKLESVDLENPIRDFEIEVIPCVEKIRQMDFFEPRTTDSDRLEKLLSLLRQADVHTGLFEVQAAILPEMSWRLADSTLQFLTNQNQERRVQDDPNLFFEASPTLISLDVGEHTTDLHHRQLQSQSGGSRSVPKKSSTQTKPLKRRLVKNQISGEPQTKALPIYSQNLASAPRPTRLLRHPKVLDDNDLSRVRLLSRNPLERLESAWWKVEAIEYAKRDYYFALHQSGQCLWIYKDLRADRYFLHGYFD